MRALIPSHVAQELGSVAWQEFAWAFIEQRGSPVYACYCDAWERRGLGSCGCMESNGQADSDFKRYLGQAGTSTHSRSCSSLNMVFSPSALLPVSPSCCPALSPSLH